MIDTTRLVRQALLPMACALLVACGGGGSDAPAASGRAQPLQASIPAAKLPLCPAPDAGATLADITTIQGAGDRSPFEDAWVSVRGVVTADFRGEGRFGGFYIQQAVPDRDPATSEGLFVFAPGSPVALAVGDYVQVSGRVREFQRSSETSPLTQIAEVSELIVCGITTPIKAVNLTLPLKRSERFEQVEGMLVRFEQPLTVTGNFGLGRFGELQLSPRDRLHHPNNHPTLEPEAARDFNARARLVLDDTSNVQNPAPIPFIDPGLGTTRRAGDIVKGSEGILSSAFGAYRLQPTVALAFEPRNPRPAAPLRTAGTLRVASLNVLNLFSTLGQRGATSADESRRQLEKLVTAVVELDADVLGLMEVENDGDVTLHRLVDAVNARAGAGSYALRSPGVPGTDQIQVAMLYRPSRVAPVGNPFVPADPDFAVDGGLRPPVAQRFAAHGNGGGFWFVVNHLKSKGSCPADAASADADRGQGCWNASRVRQAQALQRWVSELAAVSGESDMLLAGDFNAYLREDPLAVLRQAGYENLLERLPADERYTYVFDGEAGALDHALASAGLASQVASVAVWHGNADEPPVLDYTLRFKTDDRFVADAYRVSDHDPVIVDLLLNADAPAPAPTLRATLPTVGTASRPIEIRDIVATPVDGTPAVLTVDWGDGRGPQPAAAPVASNVYAEPGTYLVRLSLAQAGLQPAELVTTLRVAARPADPAAGLYISEYVEGSSFNKALELHNPGAEPADLSAYVVKLHANGSANATASLRLTGTLAPGAVLVLHHPSASLTPPAGSVANGSVINFNGDDAITLERDGAGVVDQFGQVGFDPGSAWTQGAITTLDRTLRRKPGVTRGSVPAPAPAPWALDAEWEVLPLNTFDGLGQR